MTEQQIDRYGIAQESDGPLSRVSMALYYARRVQKQHATHTSASEQENDAIWGHGNYCLYSRCYVAGVVGLSVIGVDERIYWLFKIDWSVVKSQLNQMNFNLQHIFDYNFLGTKNPVDSL